MKKVFDDLFLDLHFTEEMIIELKEKSMKKSQKHNTNRKKKRWREYLRTAGLQQNMWYMHNGTAEDIDKRKNNIWSRADWELPTNYCQIRGQKSRKRTRQDIKQEIWTNKCTQKNPEKSKKNNILKEVRGAKKNLSPMQQERHASDFSLKNI